MTVTFPCCADSVNSPPSSPYSETVKSGHFMLGGSTQLPMTVIVDADGKIVYNKVGSVTLDVLEGLVKPLLPERAPCRPEVDDRHFPLLRRQRKFAAFFPVQRNREELYAEYGDEISLVAIHSNLVTDDVDKFLAKENLPTA